MNNFTAYLCDRSGMIADQFIFRGNYKVASNCQQAAEKKVSALLARSDIRKGGAGSLFVRVVETNPYIDYSAPELPEGCRHVRDILEEIDTERARDRGLVR